MINSKLFNKEKKIVNLKNLKIGEDKSPIYIAGPCAVESKEQIMKIAASLKEIGVDVLRGGTFKLRTSPYEFQGLGVEGLKYLKQAGDSIGVPVITELIDEKYMNVVSQYADIIQIGARNMQNYSLLKAVGHLNKPILLKRGMCATIKEWIMAAEYIRLYGNDNIIMCERGIRTFNDYTRNTLDLSAVPIIRKETGFPVIVDPSHGTGIRELVIPMSRAALACGANGIIVEVHEDPDNALCDGKQSLNINQYKKLKLACCESYLL